MPIRILLLADTHLGFDLPLKARVARRRRGHDFQARLEEALAPARGGEVDLVVHGGDVFHRPRVAPCAAFQAFQPLLRVAEAGTPVFLVPGNHERGRIPHVRFVSHPRIHVFDRPRTFALNVRGKTVALAGFPYVRNVRARFTAALAETGWERTGPVGVRLLCVHHCFEGARVEGFTFREAADVVRGADIPSELDAVLTGHVHRRQVLTHDLRGRRLSAPVLYPGSVERTSFAEMREPKGYLLVEVPGVPGARIQWTERPLAARPMKVRELDATPLTPAALERRVRAVVSGVPADAVLRIRVRGRLGAGARRVLGAARLRELAPSTMNLDVVLVDEPKRPRSRRARPSATLSSNRTLFASG
jgi:DNA repair exonuclease SbcCD nuclease subunit